MLVKIVVVLMLFAIIGALGSGLVSLLRRDVPRERLARALTLRIGLSLSLFVMLLLAAAAGLIHPHGL
ncbi:DUF2909 domain-containing protein [Plasticicumulans acidivorans]|uniref:DUF2909 family protein n=1 Tax=Plasticicumulans acidivorans TaxID=886464 RepID=A0A317MW52_9GAMM|nr:DUF2909 domain-containing protein [Plasticicumulans acidivorans]PWV61699.1 hypothetical protein C7443_105127 [Plasticicumulans acidivorans]